MMPEHLEHEEETGFEFVHDYGILFEMCIVLTTFKSEIGKN